MKKKLALVMLLASLVSGCAGRAVIKTVAISKAFGPEEARLAKTETALETRSRKFIVGEQGIFTIAWKGIPVGVITSTIKEIKKFEGREVYVIELVAKTNKFLSKIYPIEDRYMTYLDTETLTSRYYEARRREGNYKKDVIVKYDFAENLAYYNNLLDGTVKTCPIIEPLHDPLSAVYYCRKLNFNLGETVSLWINLNEQNYHVFARIESESKLDIPKIGSFEAFLVRPYVTLNEEDIKKGRAWGYISSDTERYPLHGIVKIPWLGEITATLARVGYLNADER